MYQYRVDPIRYAWELCNVGVSFPGVLGKSPGASPFVPGLTSPWRASTLTQDLSGDAAVRAALPSLIVGSSSRCKT